MEEVHGDTKRGLYKRRMLALCPLAGSRLTAMNGWHVPWSWTAEGVRGIEVGIKLPVMPLANGTGEEVICHHNLLQSSPASGVIVWSLVKTLPDVNR